MMIARFSMVRFALSPISYKAMIASKLSRCGGERAGGNLPLKRGVRNEKLTAPTHMVFCKS